VRDPLDERCAGPIASRRPRDGDDFQSVVWGRVAEQLGQVASVVLAVLDHEDPRDRRLPHVLGQPVGLVEVVGHDPRERAPAGRLQAPVGREVQRRAGGTDLQQAGAVPVHTRRTVARRPSTRTRRVAGRR
jgi:hypothetical protein